MRTADLIEFVRERGLGVVASRGPDGAPQAALVGVAATDRGEILFDTAIEARKVRNIESDPQVAVVVGWEDEVTMQLEGEAAIVEGAERERCLAAYLDQFPDGQERSRSAEIVLVRVIPSWGRLSDFRPESFGSEEFWPGS